MNTIPTLISTLIPVMAVMPAYAARIAPNPNPSGNAITVSGSDFNGTTFHNNGTINMTNAWTLLHRTYNNAGGMPAMKYLW